MEKLYQKLIVFPGLSSPFNEKHKPIYDLLRNEARKREIEMEVMNYPGQKDITGQFNGELSPDIAKASAITKLQSLEEKQISYRTVGLSFGSFIPLAAALDVKAKRYWEKIVVWGMLPYWKIWTGFGKNIKHESLALDTRIIVPYSEFFRQLLPNEYLIAEVGLPVTVGLGSEDKYVDVEFFCYLKSICKTKKLHSFEYIYGCSHTVTEKDKNWQEYIKMIFS